jgi:RsiW-degrading membrane proteinase PrsW (M82 family)
MQLEAVLSHAVAFIPVLVFLAALRLMDSYKLVPRNRILVALGSGGAAAGICYLVNSAAFHFLQAHGNEYARFGAPVIEELAKGCYWMFLIATARVAFMVDAGICAFAVGAGFSLVENFLYLQVLAGQGIAVSTLRGFGTALMHGGVAAIAAMVTIFLSERRGWRGPRLFAPGLLVAMTIHSFFNQGRLSPVASTLVMLVSMPILIAAVFLWSEASLRHWLGDKLDRDIELLNMIATGELYRTHSGAYLQSLQDVFPPAIRGDMLCMLQLTIELSARAKGDLLMREAGLEIPPDPGIEAQFKELAYLEKSIGRTGLLAVAPLLSHTPRDLWEMRRLAHSR